MNIKATITILAMALATSTFAKGIYFVSGGDFRECRTKYVLKTTEPNQTLTITPNRAFTLSNYGNASFSCPWSIKTDGQEFNFSKNECIPDGHSLGQYGVAASPIQYTYAQPGNHTVKIYDVLGNIYKYRFTNNASIVYLSIDLHNPSWGSRYSKSGDLDLDIRDLPNIKRMKILLPPETIKIPG